MPSSEHDSGYPMDISYCLVNCLSNCTLFERARIRINPQSFMAHNQTNCPSNLSSFWTVRRCNSDGINALLWLSRVFRIASRGWIVNRSGRDLFIRYRCSSWSKQTKSLGLSLSACGTQFVNAQVAIQTTRPMRKASCNQSSYRRSRITRRYGQATLTLP